MIGWRARLGFLVPPGNPTVEPEMMTLAPDGVSLHFHRMVASGEPCAPDGQTERETPERAYRLAPRVMPWRPRRCS